MSNNITLKDKSLITGTIFNIQRFSIQDGPGIRTLVFLKGCPLKCIWCCNPESQNIKKDIIFRKQKCIDCGKCVEVCAVNAIENDGLGKIIDRGKCTLCEECAKNCYSGAMEIIGEIKTVRQVVEEIKKDMKVYQNSGGGVTLSGGEPIAQPEFASGILEECKKEYIHTAIETCGFSPWEYYGLVLPFTDLILFDLKHMNSEKHQEFTNQPNEMILQNFEIMASLGKNIIARFPVISGFNTNPDNIEGLGNFLKNNGVMEIHLLPYHELGVSKYSSLDLAYELNHISDISDEELNSITNTLKSFGMKVTLYSH